MAHFFDGKNYYADTKFMNSLSGVMPKMSLEHMGFGEFLLKGPQGEIEFDRMRGKDFPGQSGRSHKLYDNKNGKLVEELIKRMEKAKKSERVEAAVSGVEALTEIAANLAKAGLIDLAKDLIKGD